MEPSKFYELIGRFCIEFEQVSSWMEDIFQELLEKERVSRPDEISGLPNKHINKSLVQLVSEKIRILGASKIGAEPAAAAKPVLAAFSKLAELRNFLLHTKWIAPHQDPSFRRSGDVVVGRNIGIGRRKPGATLYPALEIDQLERAVAACAEVDSLVAFLVYGVSRGKLPEGCLPDLIAHAEHVERDITSLISSIKIKPLPSQDP